jgi:hypothetical protein
MEQTSASQATVLREGWNRRVRRRPHNCGRVGADECVAGHIIAGGLEQTSASQNRVLHPHGQGTDGPGRVVVRGRGCQFENRSKKGMAVCWWEW